MLDGGGGAPQLAAAQRHGRAGIAAGEFTLAAAGGGARLLQQGTAEATLAFYRIRADGSLADQSRQDLPGSAAEGLGAVVLAPLAGGQGAAYAVAAGGSLQGWRLDAAGGVAGAVQAAGSAADFAPGGGALLALAAEADVLLASDSAIQGLRSYRIDAATGALAAADEFGMGEGLAVSGLTALQSIEAYGKSWVLAGAAGSSSLSLLEISGDGSLSLSDHLADGLATRFGGLTALAAVALGGGAAEHHLVLAAGADDGISLFRLLPTGRLVHLQSLAHAPDLGLQNVTALAAAAEGDLLQVFAAGGSPEGGISQFSLDLSDLGEVRSAGAGARVLAGTRGDDVLLGGSGAPDLRGGSGDDVLVNGAGGGRLQGGAGADIFLLEPAASVTISDFTPGTDQLDLSLFDGLRSTAQLEMAPFGGGIRIRMGDSEVTVLRQGGGRLEAADLWPGGFAWPDRLAAGDTLPSETRYGGGGGDLLQGAEDGDRIDGLGGDDRIKGGGGNDTLEGGDGADTLQGGPGQDLLQGGRDDDLLLGGGGGDSLQGGGGNDSLRGHGGDDRLWGQEGEDLLLGNGGSDRLFGGAGHDRLLGGRGGDRLLGGSGRDTLLGGNGRDRLFGGADRDTLLGGIDRDRLVGGSGDDVLQGGRGGDRLQGGAGADVFVFAREKGRGHGRDTVADFNPGRDLIDLGGLNLAGGFADLALSRSGKDVLVATGAGLLRLEDLRPREISAEDFLF